MCYGMHDMATLERPGQNVDMEEVDGCRNERIQDSGKGSLERDIVSLSTSPCCLARLKSVLSEIVTKSPSASRAEIVSLVTIEATCKQVHKMILK